MENDGYSPGADASAMLSTSVETAKAYGLVPDAYLTQVFDHLPRDKTPDTVRLILPQQLTVVEITPLPQFLLFAGRIQ